VLSSDCHEVETRELQDSATIRPGADMAVPAQMSECRINEGIEVNGGNRVIGHPGYIPDHTYWCGVWFWRPLSEL
jgi:hypothetical protein